MSGPKKSSRGLPPGLPGRLVTLRYDKHMTQAEFAAGIGSIQATYSNYESGRVEPPSVVVDNICKTYGVRREWLETGEGEMYVAQSIDEQLAFFVADILGGTAPEFARRLIAEMARMPVSKWDALEDFALMLARAAKKEEQA